MGDSMKQAAKRFCAVLRWILFLGFSIQILLGLAWVCANFAKVQNFPEVGGPLYAWLLRLFAGAPQVLYLFQIAAACLAWRRLARNVGPSGLFWRIWILLAYLTFPMLLQCHLALLPYSFVSSLILMEISFLRKSPEGQKGVTVSGICGAGVCFLCLSALLPEYVFLGLVPVVLLLPGNLRFRKKQPKRFWYPFLAAAAFLGIVLGVRTFLPHGNREENRNSVWFCIADRMAWPKLYEDSGFWSPKLQELAGGDVAWYAGESPEQMERILKPALETAVGFNQANAYYREMAAVAWRYHKGMICRQIGWDVLTYAAPAAVLQMQLAGDAYQSCSGRNYELMFMNSPRVTKYYVSYGCWWFAVAVAAALLLAAAGCVAGEWKFSPERVDWAIVFAVWMGVILCFYTLRGSGIADYKETVALSGLWPLPAFWMMGTGMPFGGSVETEGSSERKQDG